MILPSSFQVSATNSCFAREKQGYRGNSDQEQAYILPSVPSELWYYITVLFFSALGIKYKRLRLRLLCNFAISEENRFSQDTLRAQAVERS